MLVPASPAFFLRRKVDTVFFCMLPIDCVLHCLPWCNIWQMFLLRMVLKTNQRKMNWFTVPLMLPVPMWYWSVWGRPNRKNGFSVIKAECRELIYGWLWVLRSTLRPAMWSGHRNGCRSWRWNGFTDSWWSPNECSGDTLWMMWNSFCISAGNCLGFIVTRLKVEIS